MFTCLDHRCNIHTWLCSLGGILYLGQDCPLFGAQSSLPYPRTSRAGIDSKGTAACVASLTEERSPDTALPDQHGSAVVPHRPQALALLSTLYHPSVTSQTLSKCTQVTSYRLSLLGPAPLLWGQQEGIAAGLLYPLHQLCEPEMPASELFDGSVKARELST